MNYDTSNEIFRLAAELVNHSATNIFLTGKAGTGKTTFLKYIRENCPKQMAVVAPTGVAAINAGGVTIHSFFQLPLSPFIPGSKRSGEKDDIVNPHSLIARLRISNDKKSMLEELELLIIDEISMVRCDILDEIDLVLRHIRRRHNEAFGGVQVLFIGDMFQLPPVIKDCEWKILSEYYTGPFFFDSMVMKQSPPVYIEFTRNYRQKEESFINLLNQVRNNDLDETGNRILRSRYRSELNMGENKDHIILTTHNEKAKNINVAELAKINSNGFTYRADIQDDFPATAYPTEELLHLKVGAKVMFTRNDSDKGKRYFNGKIGVITQLEESKIFVQCDTDPPIEIKKERWENIRYRLNKQTRHLEEEVLGSFSQYPLRLAWAITIHKSQGLTFEKAIIDAGEAFAAGQVYVALSRCTNLEGMILYSQIKPGSLFTDKRIIDFSQTVATTRGLEAELEKSRTCYLQRILSSLFDFDRSIVEAKELREYVLKNNSSFNTETVAWIESLEDRVSGIQKVALKFQQELKSLFLELVKPEVNLKLQERVAAAALYFANESKKISDFILQSPAITDSRLHAKEYNESLREIFLQLSLKKFLLTGIGGRVDSEAFHKRKRTFVAPSFSVNAYAGIAQDKTEIPHPYLHQQLRKLRDSICSRKDLPIYLVAGSRTVDEMATYLPQTIDELEQISGFGRAKLELYGKQFLDIIQAYCKEHHLSSQISDKISKRRRKESKGVKADTKAESLQLYKAGKSPGEIAKQRNLGVQTIEGHLAHFVEDGVIGIDGLVANDKINLIEPLVRDYREGSPLAPIKEQLGDNVSYGEIRLVIAWNQFQKNSSSHVYH
jgi:hypothetical protein